MGARRGQARGLSQLSLIRDTYLRFQVLVHEVAKFGVVGAIGYVVQLGVQNALYPAVMGALTALVIAYGVATVVTFVGNRWWAFKHRKGSGIGPEAAQFIVLNVVGIFIQIGIVALVVHGMGHTDRLSYNIATTIGIGLGTLFRLFTYRRFVFRAQPSAGQTEELQPTPSGR